MNLMPSMKPKPAVLATLTILALVLSCHCAFAVDAKTLLQKGKKQENVTKEEVKSAIDTMRGHIQKGEFSEAQADSQALTEFHDKVGLSRDTTVDKLYLQNCLRLYGTEAQIGLGETPDCAPLMDVFRYFWDNRANCEEELERTCQTITAYAARHPELPWGDTSKIEEAKELFPAKKGYPWESGSTQDEDSDVDDDSTRDDDIYSDDDSDLAGDDDEVVSGDDDLPPQDGQAPGVRGIPSFQIQICIPGMGIISISGTGAVSIRIAIGCGGIRISITSGFPGFPGEVGDGRQPVGTPADGRETADSDGVGVEQIGEDGEVIDSQTVSEGESTTITPETKSDSAVGGKTVVIEDGEDQNNSDPFGQISE